MRIVCLTCSSWSRTLRMLACFFAMSSFAPRPAPGAFLQGGPNDEVHLIPQPREARAAYVIALPNGLNIQVNGQDLEDRFAADDLRDWCKQLGIAVGKQGVGVRMLRHQSATSSTLLTQAGVAWDAAMREEGYAIVPDGAGVALIADTGAGMFYAAQTLKQLLRVDEAKASLQMVTVRDWPAMRYRGFSDDITRGGLPTMEFFKQQIRTFAAYKLNVYSLYMQTTFRYATMPAVPSAGGALTPEEARELAEYAQRYHVTVIPEQESFAHLHTLLTSQQYRELAETPLGGVLAPGQARSLQVIDGWFKELADAFPSPMLHIGADETFDLGKGQTKLAVQQQGATAVYIDFVNAIHEKLQPLGRRLLFWGDIALEAPNEVKRLPRDMLAVTWVYEPHPEGFAKWIEPFRQNGIETWVAPGVNNWRRVYPDYSDAVANIQRFVADGQALGATGVLNTAWNDEGEELPAMNWYGVLFGAAAGWQQGPIDAGAFDRNYGPIFHGDASSAIDAAHAEMREAVVPLRRDKTLSRSALLFWLDPWTPAAKPLSVQLMPMLPGLRDHAERAIALSIRGRAVKGLREADAVDALELGARKLGLLGLKFQAADRMLQLYTEAEHAQGDPSRAKDVKEMLLKIGGPGGLCQDLRDGYNEIGRLYAELWRREYRPYFLDNILGRHRRTADLWQARADWFTQALLTYQQGGKLPLLTSLPGLEAGIDPRTAKRSAAMTEVTK